MICMDWRYLRISRSLTWVISCPSKMICPSVGSSSRNTVRPSVLFPQPDSPTTPSVFPCWMVTLISSTAWSTRSFFPKYFFRLRTSSNGVFSVWLTLSPPFFHPTRHTDDRRCSGSRLNRWPVPVPGRYPYNGGICHGNGSRKGDSTGRALNLR